MPILNVKVSGVASAERSQKIAQMLSGHTQEILNKKPKLISIAISYIDPIHWIVGGETLARQKKSSVYLAMKSPINRKWDLFVLMIAVFFRSKDLFANIFYLGLYALIVNRIEQVELLNLLSGFDLVWRIFLVTSYKVVLAFLLGVF